MINVFPASEKFDSDLELDAGMHKTERATRDMMGNVGAPFSFHHKRILNLAVVRTHSLFEQTCEHLLFSYFTIQEFHHALGTD